MIFGRSFIEYNICVLISLQLVSETFLILRRTERDIIKMCVGIQEKYPLFLTHFSET